MIRLFFKLFRATIYDHFLYNVFNILGLAIGISCSLLLFLWIENELIFDRFHTDGDRIYRVIKVENFENGEIKSVLTPRILSKELAIHFPQIEMIASFSKNSEPKPVTVDGKSLKLSFSSASYNFLKVLDFPIIYQSSDSILKNENSAILSLESAKKLFGDDYPIGKTIEKYFHESTKYIVEAVVEVPKTSHLQFDIITPFSKPKYNTNFKTPWHGPNAINYLKLKDNTVLNEKLKENIEDFINEKTGSDTRLMLQPLTDIHLHTDFHEQGVTNNGDIQYVIAFAIVAILMLIISTVNYILFLFARSEKRYREIAFKRLYGLNNVVLTGQFILENVIIILIAQIASILIIYAADPLIMIIGGKQIQLTVNSKTLWFVLWSTIFIIAITSIYHSLWLSSHKLINLLKGAASMYVSKFKMGVVIVLTQLMFSFFFTICAYFIYCQLNYMQVIEKGINLKNIVAVNTLGFVYDYESIKNELLNNPNINNVTASNKPPIDYAGMNSNIEWEGKENTEKIPIGLYFTDASFIDVFGVKILEGHFLPEYLNEKDYFDKKHFKSASIVINESAQSLFGYKNPIGKKMDFGYDYFDGNIVGVIKDFHFKPLKHKISPLIFVYHPGLFREIYININQKHQSETIDYIEKVTEPYRNGKYPFDYYFLEDRANSLYMTEKTMVGFALMFAIVSVSLAIMGVIGMLSHLIKHQRKSIAVRKVFGAETKDIVFLYVKRLASIAFLSYLIAGLTAWYYLEYWLQNYAYHIRLSPLLFLQIFSIALATICVLTIALVYKEANKNPVINLKYE